MAQQLDLDLLTVELDSMVFDRNRHEGLPQTLQHVRRTAWAVRDRLSLDTWRVVLAFATGDTGTLKPLLSPEVFSNFAQSIQERERAGETMELNVVEIRAADIVEAYMAGRTAHVTVKFVSEQIVIVRNDKGDIIEGDPQHSTEATDFWTFARDTRSPNPNWTLVATGAPE